MDIKDNTLIQITAK